MDNNFMTLLPMLMGQKGGNADLMKMMASMNGGQNPSGQSNTNMMSMLANMMNTNNKGGGENNDFSKGGNEQLFSMFSSMMQQNSKGNANTAEAGFTPLKGISSDLINNMLLHMMNAKGNST